MKIAVINFSGNVGKSTVAKHLLMPRMNGAELIAIETINADEGSDETVRGKQFGRLQEQLLAVEDAVVDIGASNVEDVMKLMAQYRGSHEDFDIFVIPSVKEGKQVKDTIATIEGLRAMGVPARKIRVVFNKLEADETVEEAFWPLFAYHQDKRAFTLEPGAVIHFSELYQRLRMHKTTIGELVADETDYKAKIREAKNDEEKARLAAMLSMRRLAFAAQENLDSVFSTIAA